MKNKRCRFCEGYNYFTPLESPNKAVITLEHDEGIHYLMYNGDLDVRDGWYAQEIKYCPMCGKKLDD